MRPLRRRAPTQARPRPMSAPRGWAWPSNRVRWPAPRSRPRLVEGGAWSYLERPDQQGRYRCRREAADHPCRAHESLVGGGGTVAAADDEHQGADEDPED